MEDHLKRVPQDEGEIYFEESLHGVKTNRNTALLLFLSITIPVGVVIVILHLLGVV